MDILLAQFRLSQSAREREYDIVSRLVAPFGARVEAVDNCSDPVDTASSSDFFARFSGVILGGSADFYLSGERMDSVRASEQRALLARVEPLVSYLIARDISTLGICYGHQLLARFAGARVVADPFQAEKGTFEVSLTREGAGDPIFDGLPAEFPAVFVHRESVVDAPIGMRILARGTRSRVAAFRIGTRVYGVQFHPELSAEEMRAREMSGITAGIVQDSAALAPFADTPDTPRILANFVDICRTIGRSDMFF